MPILLSPLGLGLLSTVVLAVAWARLPRALRWLGLGVAVTCGVLLTPFGANALLGTLEQRVPASPDCAVPPHTVVVLAGGFDAEPDGDADSGALSGASLRRLLAGVALWRRTPGAALVLSGGGPYPIRETDVLGPVAEQLGVPAAALRRERNSRTTWENAEYLSALEPPLPAAVWLVTSAAHLPRALVAFRAFGFEPCAYASDREYVAPGGAGYFLPQGSALRKSELAIHELIGELVYRWRAWRRSSSSP